MYNKKTHIHFVGIGGIGMSGIATILKQQGYVISGCDADINQQSVCTLKSLGCAVHHGNNSAACHDQSIDILVYSSAIKADSPEIKAAQKRGIPIIPRALMLAELMRTKYSIAVAGSHGKTTTTSLISHILMEAQLDPTVIIGGHLKSTSHNAHSGSGNFLVAEADESDRSFLHLHPTLAIVTNVNLEHLDTYNNLDDIKDTFKQFIQRVPFYGKAILCVDDPNIRALLPIPHVKIIKYGIKHPELSNIYATDIMLGGDYSTCTIHQQNKKFSLGVMRISMPGVHNIENALAATALALELGVPFETIAQALENFKGVDRRFTYRGSCKGAEIFDDYAHHPREIDVTLKVARKRTKGRLIVVFQPQRYSRTKALWTQFIESFLAHKVDELIITDIYAASETPVDGISSENLVNAIHAANSQFPVKYIALPILKKQVKSSLQQDDLILCIGAGKQISSLSQELPEASK